MASHITFAQPPLKKQRMSLSQTYYVAASARSKLGREAARPDHNLRRLVGHANLLDSLMLELADAERDQERWFNQTVSKVQKNEKPASVQWADTIVEDDEDSEDSDSDSDDGYTEEDYIMATPLRRMRSPPVLSAPTEDEREQDQQDDEEYFDDEHLPELALTRTASNVHSPPPELIHDSDSDDESPPCSPPLPLAMDFPITPASTDKKQRIQGMNMPMIAALA